MKKIYLVSAITIILGLLFTIKPIWFRFLWGWQILLLPLVAGIFMVLVQNEDKSYRFLPKLIIGSLIISFVYLILLQVIEYDHDGYFVFWWFLIPALFLSGVCVFGGLIGIVIKGVTLLFKENPESKSVLILKKIFGVIFLSIGAIGALTSAVVFLILFFNPSSSLLNRVMVDFKLIEVIGAAGYYLLLLSTLFIISIPVVFIAILGAGLLFAKNIFFNFKVFFRLILLFFLWLAIFFALSFHTESKFEEKKAAMKENKIVKYFDIKDFDNVYISRFVKFDDIMIKQGDQFSIAAKGSQYDQIGLNFEKTGNTLFIKRSELETYYNTETWTMENDNLPFPAGTKVLSIEITMPDIEKIEIEGGNIELANFKVDNIEIKLNKRFNNIKGDIKVEDTLKLDTKGGVINLSGSAKNLIINSGDCWIEMDRFMAENAIVNAKNTSRLNLNVSDDMQIQSGENSGITNYYKEK